MNNKYFALLEELYNNYDISGGTSLNAFIKTKYGKDDSDYPKAIHLKKIFETLAQKGFIIWDACPQNEKGNPFTQSEKYKGLLGTKDDPNFQTFKEIYVEVQLTPEGLDYVEDLMDKKATRESLIKTNSSMKLLTIFLLLVGFISLCIQAKQCNIEQGQLDIQSKQNKSDTLQMKQCEANTKVSTSFHESKDLSVARNKDSLKNVSVDTTKTQHK
jgi:hypothetical protein